MMSALCICVFAETVTPDTTGTGSDGKVDVTVTPKSTVYKVTVNWGSLDFTYTNGEWNTNDLVYENGTWSNGGKSTITVTNKSNASISVAATLGTNGTAREKGVDATLDKTSLNLGSASDNGTAIEDAFTVTVSGTPKADTFTVGTVALTISTNN